jgi:hypothetical protein
MSLRQHRAFRPVLEKVEGRELLSGVIAARAHHLAVERMALKAAMSFPNFPLPSSVPYQGTMPTPKEVARERFKAVFAGPFGTGTPLFFDQTSRTLIDGVGGSNFFFNGNLQFLTVVTKSATNPVVGTATLEDRNANTSGTLIVDLTGTLADLDRFGRPTQLNWSLTPFAGSGSFTAGGFSLATGQGTVKIQYRDNGKHTPGITSQGDATAVFVGSLFVPGTVDPLTNASLQISHRRPAPF